MEQQTLFGGEVARPLASRMRPRTLEEFFGQEKLLGEGKILRQLIDSDNVPSMIFWGPPGVGKTTLARIIARRTKAEFVDFSAVTSGVKEIKAVMERAEDVQATLVVFSRDVIRAGAGLLDGLRAFIDDAYVEASPFRRRTPQEGAALPSNSWMPAPPAPGMPAPDLLAPAPAASAEPPAPAAAAPMASMSAPRDLSDLLDHLDESFSTTLLALIDARGLTDAQVYKRANISRQLFSKIRSNPAYRPTKPTAVALGVALGLTLDELRDLLARAGFALSRSSRFDVIVEFYVARGVYDIFRINEALFAYDEQLLGSI